MKRFKNVIWRCAGICVLAVCMAVVCANGSYCSYLSVNAGCDNGNDTSPAGGTVYGSDGHTPLPVGSMIQYIYAGPNGVADAPSAVDGSPTGDDVLLAAKMVGTDEVWDAFTAQPGLFYCSVTATYTSGSPLVYVRAWNGSTFSTSTAYGNSQLFSPVTGANPPIPNDVGIPSFSTVTAKPAPNAPTGFVGTAESVSTIQWSWNSVANALYYNVCSSDGTVIASVDSGTSTIETGLPSGNYPFVRYVKARLSNGQITNNSIQYIAYSMANTPVAVTANSGWNSTWGYYVTVTWEAANSAGTQYYLQRHGQSDLTPTTAKINTEESISASLADTAVTYEVRAINGNGVYTSYSNTVTTVLPPAAPTLHATNVGTNEITWYWNSVPGASTYTFMLNGSPVSSSSALIATSELLNACQAYSGTVYAISNIYGAGAQGNAIKSTLPVVPNPFIGGTSLTPRSVDLSWTPDSGNASALYEVQMSATSSVDGYVTKESGTSNKTDTILCDQENTYYWFRIRAKNADGVYSAFTDPLNIESSAGGGGGGTAPIIWSVKFNDRTYLPGNIVSSTPIITAFVSGEVDQSFKSIIVDPGLTTQMIIPVDDITYETSAPNLPPGDLLLRAVVRTAIPATPVNAHTISITAKNPLGATSTWNGNVVVMRGEVEVIGRVYNYPNPFKPLSTDPSQNTTTIAYTLNVDAPVSIIIYDITGHQVHMATYGKSLEGGKAGINQITWNGKSLFNEAVGNGMYVYKIISNNRVIATGKVVVFD